MLKIDWIAIDWTKTNAMISREVKCSVETVRKTRTKLGIPKARQRKGEDLPRLTSARDEALLAMRAEGATFRECGKRFNVTHQRAQQICASQ